MKTKIIYKLYYYSYMIIYVLFFTYSFLYAFLLNGLSKYYTYLLFIFIGLILGYIIADRAHKYLKKMEK